MDDPFLTLIEAVAIGAIIVMVIVFAIAFL